jgi:hypothetical protein
MAYWNSVILHEMVGRNREGGWLATVVLLAPQPQGPRPALQQQGAPRPALGRPALGRPALSLDPQAWIAAPQGHVLGIGTIWKKRGCESGCVVGSGAANRYRCTAAQREWTALGCAGNLPIETSTNEAGSDCGWAAGLGRAAAGYGAVARTETRGPAPRRGPLAPHCYWSCAGTRRSPAFLANPNKACATSPPPPGLAAATLPRRHLGRSS